MLYQSIRHLVIMITILFSFAACGNEDVSENAARLRIKLTDAASPVIRELYIDIRQIEVYVTDTTDNNGEWIPLAFTGGEYNLLRLMNGKTVQLVDQYFPAGKRIEKIKLIPGSNNRFITVTSENIPLNIPPEIAEGIIIENVNAILVDHIITSVVIDVNAALTVRESNGNYFLHPVARAFPETFGGMLRGFVEPVEAVAFIAVVHDSDTLMTLPEADGMFMFTGLMPGPWEIHLRAHPEANYRDTAFTDTIVAGQVRDITPKPVQMRPK